MQWRTGKKGNKFLIDTDAPIIYKNSYTNLPEYKLNPKEYGMVIHEMNNWFRNRHIGKTITLSSIKSHTYTIEIYGYNDYRIIGKKKIVSRK